MNVSMNGMGAMRRYLRLCAVARLAPLLGIVLALCWSNAQAAFYPGTFDPPDLHGTHIFEVNGCPSGGPDANQSGGCVADLYRLTAYLDTPAHTLNTSGLFHDVTDIIDVFMLGNQLIGVDSTLIGPFAVPGGTGIYAGNFWIEYDYSLGPPPPPCFEGCRFVAQFVSPGQVVNLYNCAQRNLLCLVDTAPLVTFNGPFDTPNGVPEPATLILLLAGLASAAAARRRPNVTGSYPR